MQIRRGLLFWGLFLIPLGAVPLLVRAGVVDAATVAKTWQLWPVILIALGLAIVAGRSQVAVVGTAVTAVILGLAAGGALATGSPWFGVLGDCANGRNVNSHEDQTGTFTSPATIRLDLSCGDFQLATQSGSDWALHADFNGPPPVVTAAPNALEVKSPTSGNGRRQSWNVKVPSSAIGGLEIHAAAGSGTADLAGATLTSVTAGADAFDLTIDAGEARVGRVDMTTNAGRSRITLGSGPVSGSLSVNAGAIDLCVPTGSPLRIRLTDQLTFAHNLDDRGLVKSGGTWTRSGTDPESVIDLTVDGAAASFTLDPQGGCR
jgi:hypothetical protein